MSDGIWRAALALMRVIDATNRRVGRAMTWPILGAVLVSAGNAISRKAFDLSSNAMLELQWYLFGLAFLGAAGYVVLVEEHVRIDAVAQQFTARTRATIDILVLLAYVMPLVVLLGSMGWTLTAQAWTSGEVSSNAGGLPRWPAFACIPLGMTLLGLQAVAGTVRRSAWLAGRLQAPTPSEKSMPPLIGPRESASCAPG